MQPYRDYLYYILDDQNRSYVRMPSGLVVAVSIPTFITDSPAGWEDQSIKWIRNRTFKGVTRSMTAPFTFSRDGATIMRYLYYTYGIQAYGRLLIQERDNDNIYRDYFEGGINFSKVSDNQPEGFEAEVAEEGLSEMINANRSTTYEMSVNVPEAIDVTMDGIELFSNVDVLNYADTFQDSEGNVIPNVRTEAVVNIGTTISQTETAYPSVIWNDFTNYAVTDVMGNIPTSWGEEWLFKVTEDSTVSINTVLRASAATNLFRVGYFAWNELTGATRFVQLATGSTGGFPQDLSIPINDANLFYKGEKVYLIWNMDVAGSGETVSFGHFPDFGADRIRMVYNYRKESTVVKWLPPMYVFSELIKRITKGKYTASSSLLTGAAASFLLSSGDAIRGFETAVIKLSLDDLFKSYNVPFNTSLSIKDGVVYLEDYQYAYNNNDIVNLGELEKLVVSPSDEDLFNRVRVGWPNQDYNDVNGRFEFNTTALYGTIITKINTEFEIVSTIRADGFGIEFTRINLENKTTTDSDSDENVFMLDVQFTGPNTAIINRPADITVSGIPNASSVFNIRLSPARCVRAHGSEIRTGLHNQENTVLEYLTKNKNAEISTMQPGIGVISEKADIPVNTLSEKILLPVRFKATCKLPLNIRSIIDNDPNGKISFEWFGNTYKGYIIEASQEPSLNPTQEFDLICSADTNLKNLIV